MPSRGALEALRPVLLAPGVANQPGAEIEVGRVIAGLRRAAALRTLMPLANADIDDVALDQLSSKTRAASRRKSASVPPFWAIRFSSRATFGRLSGSQLLDIPLHDPPSPDLVDAPRRPSACWVATGPVSACRSAGAGRSGVCSHPRKSVRPRHRIVLRRRCRLALAGEDCRAVSRGSCKPTLAVCGCTRA